MSVETDRLTLRLIPPDEARRIVEGKPAEHDSWADGFPREDDADGVRMLARAEPPADPGASSDAPRFGSLLIIDRATGQAIGSIGFYGPPDDDGQVTIGYGLVEQHRGQGLGTEALNALIDYCRDTGQVSSVLADTEIGNLASRRVLEKGGFTFLRADDELCYYQLTL